MPNRTKKNVEARLKRLEELKLPDVYDVAVLTAQVYEAVISGEMTDEEFHERMGYGYIALTWHDLLTMLEVFPDKKDWEGKNALVIRREAMKKKEREKKKRTYASE